MPEKLCYLLESFTLKSYEMLLKMFFFVVYENREDHPDYWNVNRGSFKVVEMLQSVGSNVQGLFIYEITVKYNIR